MLANKTLTQPTAPRRIGLDSLTTERQRWHAYEAAKALWLARNPAASAQQIETAFAAIAKRLGL